MKKIRCIFCVIIFLSLPPVTSNAQVQFGIKLGRVYLTNVKEFNYSSGYSAEIFLDYPLNSSLSLGIESGYMTKGALAINTFSEKLNHINYVVLSFPVKYVLISPKNTEVYAIAKVGYDFVLTDNVVRFDSDIVSFNSNCFWSVGAGLRYVKSNPSFLFEISYSRDFGEFIKYKTVNSWIDFKIGLLFDGL